MAETKFTPGPWQYIEHGTENASVYIDEDCVVAGAYRGGNEDLLSPDNAHLIAAAPDLYEALKAVEWANNGRCPQCDRTTHTNNCILGNALAKAVPHV